jgi:hypothetical protein
VRAGERIQMRLLAHANLRKVGSREGQKRRWAIVRCAAPRRKRLPPQASHLRSARTSAETGARSRRHSWCSWRGLQFRLSKYVLPARSTVVTDGLGSGGGSRENEIRNRGGRDDGAGCRRPGGGGRLHWDRELRRLSQRVEDIRRRLYPFHVSVFDYPRSARPSVFPPGPPDGPLTRATVNGADYLTCGAHRLLLPGYVAPPAPVPTMTEWAMILLGAALAGAAALTVQRRRTA